MPKEMKDSACALPFTLFPRRGDTMHCLSHAIASTTPVKSRHIYNHVDNRSTKIVMIPRIISTPMRTMTIVSSRSPWLLLTLSLSSVSMSCRTWNAPCQRAHPRPQIEA